MKTIATFLTSLSVAEKAISALVGALAVGVLLGAVGVREPLATIKANTALIEAHIESEGHSGVDSLQTSFERFVRRQEVRDSLVLGEIRRTNCFLANVAEGSALPQVIRECGLR